MNFIRISLFAILLIVSTIPVMAEEMLVTGFTEPLHDVVLGLPEPGRISLVRVKEGDYVRKGQVLLNIDKRIEELEVQRRSLVANSDEDLKFATIKAGILKKQYESAKTLRTQGNVISREEFETKKLEYEQSASDVDKIGVQKKLQKIELDLASAKLNRRILKSPFSGYIAELTKETGESTQAHEKLVRVVDSTTGVFVGSVEASKVLDIKKGSKVLVRLKTMAGVVEKPGVISFVSPTIDTASGLIKIKAEFDNTKNKVKLGATASLVIK